MEVGASAQVAVMPTWARAVEIAFGLSIIIGAISLRTMIGGRGYSGLKRPITKAERIIFLVFGPLFVLWGIMGWE